MVTTQYDYITCKHIHHINNGTGGNHIFLRHLSNTSVSTTAGLYFVWVVSEETVE
jgi:hypothetical protein